MLSSHLWPKSFAKTLRMSWILTCSSIFKKVTQKQNKNKKGRKGREEGGKRGTGRTKSPIQNQQPLTPFSLLDLKGFHYMWVKLGGPGSFSFPKIRQLGFSLIATVTTSQPRVLAQFPVSHRVTELPSVSEPSARPHLPSQTPRFLACLGPFEETEMPCFLHARKVREGGTKKIQRLNFNRKKSPALISKTSP